MIRNYLILFIILFSVNATAQTPQVVDVPTRAGVTQRALLLQSATATPAKAVVILFAGGDGGIQIGASGDIRRSGNFLVRSRDLFAAQGLAVMVFDAPSDRQEPPFMDNFRQTSEHVSDIKATIAWARRELKLPVWLIGTSRGTQSVAYAATQLPLAEGGPDGIVLTSSILFDRRSRPVPGMALDRISVPVLVAHHRLDSCRACQFSDLPNLTSKLKHLKRTETLVFEGGDSVGDPCEARAYHGYNGIEAEVVAKIAAWVTGT
jgi:dienelactone hydrolase